MYTVNISDLLGSPTKTHKPAFEMIHSGTLETEDTFKSGDRAADLFAPAPTATGMVGMNPILFTVH